MKPTIPPIDRHRIKAELTEETFLRYTNFGHREVHIVTAHNAPDIMLEIGRLRELTFRAAGGGTGKETDIDEFDTMPVPYKQLVVWDAENEEFVGGYRFIEGAKTAFAPDGTPLLSTTEIFKFSSEFLTDILPNIIELGRSFVQPKYQSTRNGVFSLDNLWDGLGGVVYTHPEIQGFFGKVTMYEHFEKEARDTLLYFVQKYFPDPDRLVYPVEPLALETDPSALAALYDGLPLEEAYKVMSRRVRELGENVPPLFNSYLKLSPTMRSFGTAVNHHFGDVEETGILIRIAEIYASKKERHIPTGPDAMVFKR